MGDSSDGGSAPRGGELRGGDEAAEALRAKLDHPAVRQSGELRHGHGCVGQALSAFGSPHASSATGAAAMLSLGCGGTIVPRPPDLRRLGGVPEDPHRYAGTSNRLSPRWL